MNPRSSPVVLAGIVAIVLSLACGEATARPLYRLTDLGILGGTGPNYYGDQPHSVAVDINSSGQVTGFSSTDDMLGPAPFLWDGTTLLRLGTQADLYPYPQAFATGRAINDAGQVTGVIQDDLDLDVDAFRSDGTTIQDLGHLGGYRSYGVAINAAGHVAGYSWTADSGSRAFFWNGGAMANLGTFGGTESRASDINDSGQVTGHATTVDGRTHAFLWTGGSLQDLGTLGGGNSSGVAINSSGHVAGTSDSHAFLWNGTQMIDLCRSGCERSSAHDINAVDQVVGNMELESGGQHAFLWDGSSMLDLGTPVAGSTSWAAAINDRGQVTGEYFWSKDGHFHAFLWDGDTIRDLNWLVDPSDPLKKYVDLSAGVAINNRGQIAVNGHDRRINQDHAYVATPLQYEIIFITPAADSMWKSGDTVPVRIALRNAAGKRISDTRAKSLSGASCKVAFSATGTQSVAATCMTYDAVHNVFVFNWKLAATGTGPTTLTVAATYKFSMPETITTTKSRAIAIID